MKKKFLTMLWFIVFAAIIGGFVPVQEVHAWSFKKFISNPFKATVDLAKQAADAVKKAAEDLSVAYTKLTIGRDVSVLALGDPLTTLLVIDLVSCRINIIWGGCDNGAGGGGGGNTPVADLKVGTNLAEVAAGATQYVMKTASDVDGPITVSVPDNYYIVKWASANADNCDLTADGVVTPNVGKLGNISVSKATNGTHSYTINCAGATDSLTVTVIGPSVTLSGRTPIEMPDPLVLTWTSDKVITCTASGAWNGVKPLVGGEEAYASTDGRRGDHTFVMTCADANNNLAVSSTTVTVLQVPRCEFSANPAAITGGVSSMLNWECRYADACSIDNAIGVVNPVNGSMRVRPPVSTQYILSCNGVDGTRTFGTNVIVDSKPIIKETLPGSE